MEEELEMADNTVETIDNMEFTDAVDASSEDKENIDKEIEIEVDNTEADISKTKSFAQRLKEERSKIEAESQSKLNNIAIARGFNNWKELEEYTEKEKLQSIGVENIEEFKKILNETVENNPIVQQAKEIIERQSIEEGNRILNDQIKEIALIDNEIKTFDDLLKMDNFEEFDILVRERNYSLVDAYKIANFDKLSNKIAKQTKQKVYNNINNKGHITTMTGNAGKSITIPNELLQQYIDEGFTAKEAEEHYAKMHEND